MWGLGLGVCNCSLESRLEGLGVMGLGFGVCSLGFCSVGFKGSRHGGI